ncbi:hypothetical protein HMPREF1860_01547, partial [Prevotella amnii]
SHKKKYCGIKVKGLKWRSESQLFSWSGIYFILIFFDLIILKILETTLLGNVLPIEFISIPQ